VLLFVFIHYTKQYLKMPVSP